MYLPYALQLKMNDSYVQLSFICTETTEGLQKPQRLFVLYYCIFKPYHLDCENILTTEILKQIFQVMMLNH